MRTIRNMLLAVMINWSPTFAIVISLMPRVKVSRAKELKTGVTTSDSTLVCRLPFRCPELIPALTTLLMVRTLVEALINAITIMTYTDRTVVKRKAGTLKRNGAGKLNTGFRAMEEKLVTLRMIVIIALTITVSRTDRWETAVSLTPSSSNISIRANVVRLTPDTSLNLGERSPLFTV